MVDWRSESVNGDTKKEEGIVQFDSRKIIDERLFGRAAIHCREETLLYAVAVVTYPHIAPTLLKAGRPDAANYSGLCEGLHDDGRCQGRRTGAKSDGVGRGADGVAQEILSTDEKGSADGAGGDEI